MTEYEFEYGNASMKVPPKRKGNSHHQQEQRGSNTSLNESPSEKEGKWLLAGTLVPHERRPSMKVPPKRKGNDHSPG